MTAHQVDKELPMPTRNRITQTDLANGLASLGLRQGDVVLVRAGLGALGKTSEKAGPQFINAILKTIGKDGTLIALAHTKTYRSYKRFFKNSSKRCFHKDTPPVIGAFSSCLCNWPGALRSAHPTNSMVAVGPDSEQILRDHDENAKCFAPMEKIIELGGKMLLVGCTTASPGFSSVHYIYERLGLADKVLTSGWYGAYYRKGSRVRWFKKIDEPGCSRGFGNFYPLYEKDGVLSVGNVGNALSYLIDAKRAYDIEYEAIVNDPKISLCENIDCFSCRVTKPFNRRDLLKYYAHKVGFHA